MFKAAKSIKEKGFTLIETLVGVAVFLVISTAAYEAYISLFNIINLNQYKIVALNLANERFEVIRNLPYSEIGQISGIPSGQIPHVETFVRSGLTFIATTTIRNVDLPFDGTIGGVPNDLSPADNKLVEIEIGCTSCKDFTPIFQTTTIAPKNLETATTNGALFVKVFDANGIAVPNASVHIAYTATSSPIIIDDVTDANGMLRIVDVPPAVQAYNIVVSKSGYSTARTYPPGGLGNPDPIQPDATVVLQQVTQVSFSIDKLSTVSLSSVNSSCSPVAGLNFSLEGSKVIGTNVLKYSQNLQTNGSGTYSNNSMEWDSYTIKDIDNSYDISGFNPVNPVYLNPDSTKNIQISTVSNNPKSLLVSVVDNGLQLPVTDAVVTLTNGGYNSSKTTDRGYLSQTDWSGGDGQSSFTDPTKYYYDDGNVDVSSNPGELTLKNAFGSYASSGVLESSIFDTGSVSNFHNISWSPTDQPVQTGANSVKFQIASNLEVTATTTWQYLGPDGTSGTYYTTSNQNVNSVHNGDRFIRYKVFLSTTSSTSTPNLSDVSITNTSSCTPPGQVLFSGLSSGTYHISVSATGYSTYETDFDVSNDWSQVTTPLSL